jgi:hypothetical protein
MIVMLIENSAVVQAPHDDFLLINTLTAPANCRGRALRLRALKKPPQEVGAEVAILTAQFPFEITDLCPFMGVSSFEALVRFRA